jgi:hypothetical protein
VRDRLRRRYRLVDAEGRDAARRGQAELAEDFLPLVFVYFHLSFMFGPEQALRH